MKHNWGNDYKCSLPEEILIQLKSSDQHDLRLDFVLCSVIISVVDHEDCYAYHFIPTDSRGQIKLTKEDLIYNTELQYYYDNNLPIENSITQFDILITPQEFIRYFNHGAYNDDKPIEEFKANNKLDWHTARWIFFMEQHDLNSASVKKCRNLDLNYDSQKSIISGNWTEDEKYKCELTMQP
jgi:hypothetical protein